MLTNLLNFSNLYFIFQPDSDCKNPFSNHQNSETDQSGDQTHQYVAGKNHDPYQLENDLVLPNDYDHIHSDLDFLRFPFVNQEYFTELEANGNSFTPTCSLMSDGFLSEEMATINQSSSSFSGNHRNITGSVLHLYNKE